MAYYTGLSTCGKMTQFWNRRKKSFQPEPCKDCEYPTWRGVIQVYRTGGKVWKLWDAMPKDDATRDPSLAAVSKSHFEKNAGYF